MRFSAIGKGTVMRFIDRRLRCQIAAAAFLLAAPFATSGWMPAAHAASNVQALLAEAEHNTNTVNTLAHTDQNTVTTATMTLKVRSHGAEDEIHNREQDYESVSVTGHGAAGKIRNLHYTVDIIFMNGLTYYRTSLTHNVWATHPGMTFPDPYTGGWKRGRTTVSFPKSVKFKEVGTSGGQTQVRASIVQPALAGTIDLWISGGAKPYIAREDERYHPTKGKAGSAHVQISFGPFNSPTVIEPPAKLGST